MASLLCVVGFIQGEYEKAGGKVNKIQIFKSYSTNPGASKPHPGRGNQGEKDYSVNFITWKPALEKAGLEPRSLYQTRHTFATLMLDAGELPGWVQQMMGHASLIMILERYYAYIKNYQRDDGAAFMNNVYAASLEIETDDEQLGAEN